MADDNSKVTCANPECRVGETGKCVEGLVLSECPHYGSAQESAEGIEGIEDQADTGRREAITLPSGELLSVKEAASLLRRGEARVIALIGPTEAGKTTLVASLYDLFQRGPVDDFQFRRSETLYAFERGCHEARAASQRATPHTKRTPIGSGVGFFHLGLCGAKDVALEVVLSDRAGEEYRAAGDDPSVARDFTEVLRADVLTMLVDGERLLDLGARHNVRSEVEMTLQALLDGDVLSEGQRLAVVLTKADLIEESAQRDRANADFTRLAENVRRLFGSVFRTIEPFQVAASPSTTIVPRGYGLSDLLGFWTAPTTIVPARVLPLRLPARAMERIQAVRDE